MDEAESENASLRLARQDAQVSSRELEGQVARLTAENDALAEDANTLSTEAKRLREEVGRLTDLNDALTDQSSGLERHRSREPSIVGRCHENPGGTAGTRGSAESTGKDLNEKSALLEARSKRVEELESLLEARERAAEALRPSRRGVAWFRGQGFECRAAQRQGLRQHGGQIVVSQRKCRVDPGGREALQGLASVIAEQSDLEIVVEGHTDTDQVQATSIPRNNWELSVLRATAVVNICSKMPGLILPCWRLLDEVSTIL